MQSDSDILDVLKENSYFINSYLPTPPKQPNSYDCGIYLLIYAELFLYEPEFLLKSFRDKQKTVLNWFSPKFVENKREEIKRLIQEIRGKSEGEADSVVEKYKIKRDLLIEGGEYIYTVNEMEMLSPYEYLISSLSFINASLEEEPELNN